MSQQERKQFSVLLNYNKNQSGSDASDFTALYSKDLVIPPMSKVALYSASLIRKPIVLTTDQEFDIELTSALAQNDGELLDPDYNPPQPYYATVTIPKGTYSKREFLDTLQSQSQSAIDALMLNELANYFIPYVPVVTIGKEDIFFSIAPNIDNSTYFETFPYSETDYGTNHVDLSASGVAFEHSVDANTWNNFAFCKNSIFPFTRNHREDYDTNQNNTDWFFNVDLVGTEQLMVGFLSQAIQKTSWADDFDVETAEVIGSSVGLIPRAYLGLVFNKSQNNSNAVTCTLVIDSNLSTRTTSAQPIVEMLSLFDINITDLTASGIFGFKFYYENTINNQDEENDVFYFKVYGKTTNTSNYYQVTAEDVLFDSRTINLSLQRSFVEESFKKLVDPIYYPAGEIGGLVPFVAMNNVSTAATNENGLVSVNTMSLNENEDSGEPLVGISRFSIKNVTDELSYIFGFKEQLYLDPNAFPNVATPDNGVVSLYSDSIGYNVEITNVGIKTQNNTINTNPGNDRPCVYRIQNEESDLSDFNQTFRRITHYSPQIKFVDLDNREPLHINNLNIKIRRDVTNQVATEIQDTKLELLFC
jgi:hypothetical protein